MTAKLQAELATREAAEKARLAADDDAFLEHLRTASAEAQAPIDAAKIGSVQKLLKDGQRDTARVLGEAYLEAARAKNQTKADLRAGNGVKSDHKPAQDVGVDGAEALLKAAGFEVLRTADGSQIATATRHVGKGK